MFVGIMSSMSETQARKQLSERGERITKILSAESGVSFIKSNRVDETRLKRIVGDYDALKDEFDYDRFCIYFEDQDGNVIPVEGVKVGIPVGNPDEEGFFFLDTDGDGEYDHTGSPVDTDGDGNIDFFAVDDNKDGELDIFEYSAIGSNQATVAGVKCGVGG